MKEGAQKYFVNFMKKEGEGITRQHQEVIQVTPKGLRERDEILVELAIRSKLPLESFIVHSYYKI